jgi:hypothetical protein
MDFNELLTILDHGHLLREAVPDHLLQRMSLCHCISICSSHHLLSAYLFLYPLLEGELCEGGNFGSHHVIFLAPRSGLGLINAYWIKINKRINK